MAHTGARHGQFKRNENPGRFVVSYVHVRIVDLVYKYRYLTLSQLASLLSGWKESSLKKPLRALYDHKFLIRPFCQVNLWRFSTKPELIYMLGSKGAELLREELGCSIPYNTWDDFEFADTIKDFKHDIALSKYLVKLRASGKEKGITVNYTWDMFENGLLSEDNPVRWTIGGNSIVPDMPFVLEKNGKKKLVLIEMDRATEPQKRLKNGTNIERKFKKYMQAYRAGQHTETYGTNNMRVLFITTSDQRINNMRKLTEDLGIRDRLFLFTTSKAVLADNPLTHEYITNRDELTALV